MQCDCVETVNPIRFGGFRIQHSFVLWLEQSSPLRFSGRKREREWNSEGGKWKSRQQVFFRLQQMWEDAQTEISPSNLHINSKKTGLHSTRLSQVSHHITAFCCLLHVYSKAQYYTSITACVILVPAAQAIWILNLLIYELIWHF